MLGGAGGERLPTGGHDLGPQEAVGREAVLAGQPSSPAAQGVAGDTDRVGSS
jgi:hypothetical protein